MEFGKLANVDRIQFKLPPHERRSLEILARAQQIDARDIANNPPTRVLLGAPIWSCKEWIGKLYPPKTPPRDFLKLYSQQFNSIELNSTFYGTPDVKTIQEWRNSVPAGFKFAPKISQQISHDLDQSLLRPFFSAMQHFEETLGICFLQLPPHFAPDRIFALKKLLQSIPKEIELAIEFRHPAWFRQQTIRQDLFDLLATYRTATVITDVAGRQDVLHASLPVPKVMIRFVGNELHPSDYTRAASWVERVGQWLDMGMEQIYFFVHHPTMVHVPELANFIIQKLNQNCSVRFKELDFEAQSEQQMSLF